MNEDSVECANEAERSPATPACQEQPPSVAEQCLHAWTEYVNSWLSCRRELFDWLKEPFVASVSRITGIEAGSLPIASSVSEVEIHARRPYGPRDEARVLHVCAVGGITFEAAVAVDFDADGNPYVGESWRAATLVAYPEASPNLARELDGSAAKVAQDRLVIGEMVFEARSASGGRSSRRRRKGSSGS